MRREGSFLRNFIGGRALFRRRESVQHRGQASQTDISLRGVDCTIWYFLRVINHSSSHLFVHRCRKIEVHQSCFECLFKSRTTSVRRIFPQRPLLHVRGLECNTRTRRGDKTNKYKNFRELGEQFWINEASVYNTLSPADDGRHQFIFLGE